MIGLFLVIAFASVGSWPGLQEQDTTEVAISEVVQPQADANESVETNQNTENRSTESPDPVEQSTFAFALAFASSLMWIPRQTLTGEEATPAVPEGKT